MILRLLAGSGSQLSANTARPRLLQLLQVSSSSSLSSSTSPCSSSSPFLAETCQSGFQQLFLSVSQSFNGYYSRGPAGPNPGIQQHHVLTRTTGSMGAQPWTAARRGLATKSATSRSADVVFGQRNFITLHATAWQQQYGAVLGLAMGAAIAFMLWRASLSLSSNFVDVSQSEVEIALMGLAIGTLISCGMYLRHYYVADPSHVFQIALSKLKSSPAIHEVMGSPLVNSDVRAVITSGGGLYMRNLSLRRHSSRVQLVFPVSGTKLRGLVLMEAKKKQGEYLVKLLAVDIPTAGSEKEQRIYVVGCDDVYDRGELLGHLRDPLLKVASLQPTFDTEDDADEERELKEKEKELKEKATWPQMSLTDRLLSMLSLTPKSTASSSAPTSRSTIL